jgi:chemotaxis protein CheX
MRKIVERSLRQAGLVPDLSANCGLSVPAVISGSDYNLHVQSPEFKIHQAFCFDDTRFELTIVCDGMQSLWPAESNL